MYESGERERKLPKATVHESKGTRVEHESYLILFVLGTDGRMQPTVMAPRSQLQWGSGKTTLASWHPIPPGSDCSSVSNIFLVFCPSRH